mmetsp:Transcript_9629/g.24919  ORF Transcript_9629/g.24919 Transcript_9629/m.24919 type:complete len:268 (+) Transcript_9629:1500-2303(+)
MVLDLFHQRVDRLLPPRVGRALVLERVRLVDEEHAAKRTLHRVARELRCLAVVWADEVLARHLDQLAGLEYAERAHHARDELGHLCLPRARVAEEQHVEHALLLHAEVCAPALHLDRVAQRLQHRLHIGEANELLDLALQIGDVLLRRQVWATAALLVWVGILVAGAAAVARTRAPRPGGRAAASGGRSTQRDGLALESTRGACILTLQHLCVLKWDVQPVARRAAEVTLALELAIAVRRCARIVEAEADDSVAARELGGTDIHCHA